MNKDRELLLLAAKAAGLVVVDDSPAVTLYVRAEGCHGGVRWNPLSSDADAMELSLILGISSEHVGIIHDDDWRRAITISAAEIGRSLP